MEEFSIREATPEDKQAVLDCHKNVYDGFDYLPEFYDYFMAAQHMKAFVLLHGEKVIGFNAGMIIDDGMTMVSRAARINTQYEGKGLYRILDDNLTDWAKSRHVTIKSQATTDLTTVVAKPSFQKKNQLIVSRCMLRYIFEKATLQQIKLSDEETQAVKVVGDNLLVEYITAQTTAKYLFPQDRLIINFVPYRLIASNVSLMNYFEAFTDVFTDVHTQCGKQRGLISFGTSYKVPAFSCSYNINIYGNDINSFERHVQKHLSRLKQKTVDRAAVTLIVDETFLEEMIDEVLQQYGATKAHSSPRHQLLFEMQL